MRMEQTSLTNKRRLGRIQAINGIRINKGVLDLALLYISNYKCVLTMKKYGFICFIGLLSLMVGCKQHPKITHYELVGGNPQIDYLDFLNDTMCKFVAPGLLTITSHYSKQKDTYVIQVSPLIKARLYKVDNKTLQGEPPFFDGIWVIKKKQYQ